MHINRHRRALTLAELIVATTITTLLAAGVGSILFAASYGTSSRRDVRRLAVRSAQARPRIDDAIRSAAAVLAKGSSYIVLWTGDSRKNNQVNLSELQLIELSSTTLTSYTTAWPSGWSQATIDAADTTYAANTNFYTTAQNAKSSGNFPGTTWATSASNFTITLDSGTANLAVLVTWKLTLTNDLLSQALVEAVALRNHVVPQ
jgi:hypothetical protein